MLGKEAFIIWIPNFKPYKTFNVLVEEKYPCGHGDGLSKGRSLVYYLCKCELCGKEFILSGDEVAKHPYSCGCTPKPKKEKDASPVDKKTKSLLSSRRRIRNDNTSGAPGVWLNKQGRWIADFYFHGTKIHLGTFKTKDEAIKARVEAEKKYYPEDSDNEEKEGE